MVADHIDRISDDLWNVRGTFRVFGLLNVGTQMSLARLASGRFVLLDSYPLRGSVAEQVLARTDGGHAVEAIFNLHPFHTVHVEAVAAAFPHARLFGTSRHHALFPELRWEPERTEDAAFAARYPDDFDFMVPAGVHLVPPRAHVHFSSVLAFHRPSAVLHVDDTLNWTPLPLVGGRLSFHPTLRAALEDRPGAATDFRAWARSLADRCESVRHVCTAHARRAPLSDDPPGGIAARVREALDRVEKTLRAHEARHPSPD